MRVADPQNRPPASLGPLGLRLELMKRREGMGLSIRGMAHAADVSHETVRRLERGHMPLPHQALKLAGAYGMDYYEIVPFGSRMRVAA